MTIIQQLRLLEIFDTDVVLRAMLARDSEESCMNLVVARRVIQLLLHADDAAGEAFKILPGRIFHKLLSAVAEGVHCLQPQSLHLVS